MTIQGAEGYLTYPGIPLLDLEGDILIDSDYEQKGNVPIDIIIPTDLKMVNGIFDRDEDYVLEYALKYLDEN